MLEIGIAYLPQSVFCLLYTSQRIARAVFQLFGRNEIAVAARIKGVDGGDFGIGESLRDERPVRAVEPEACACQRNDLACFSVHLDDLDIALKIAVVGKVAVGLPPSNVCSSLILDFTKLPSRLAKDTFIPSLSVPR